MDVINLNDFCILLMQILAAFFIGFPLLLLTMEYAVLPLIFCIKGE